MNTRRFDHLDLRVTDYAEARAFYDAWLPQMGFTRIVDGGEEWMGYYVEAPGPTEFVGFFTDPTHLPNANRISFWADTRLEVDRLTEIVRAAGARNIEGPEVCEDYSPGYYAVFFEDPCGNRFEICCRMSEIPGSDPVEC